ncbi:MAG: STAS domain-containing protein [Planctomycetota bacterium]|nr:STAS domain-containing protein [Planctomycetota bacterium]MDA1105468.1 STAS domain-containing protein [Planctomycetota bacterium]
MSGSLPPESTSAYSKISWNGATLRIAPRGPHVGQKEAPVLANEVEPYFKEIGKGLRHVVLELSSVQFMSSMGLGFLINCRTAANNAGATPIVVGANKELKGLLSMMKIDKFFKFAADESELKGLLGK